MNKVNVKLTPEGIAVAERCREVTEEYIREAEEYNNANNTSISWRLFEKPWYSRYMTDDSLCMNVELEKAQGIRPVYMLDEDDKPVVKKPRGKGKSKDTDEEDEVAEEEISDNYDVEEDAEE